MYDWGFHLEPSYFFIIHIEILRGWPPKNELAHDYRQNQNIYAIYHRCECEPVRPIVSEACPTYDYKHCGEGLMQQIIAS